MKYKIVTSSSPEGLEKKVTQLVEEGYEPTGGVNVNNAADFIKAGAAFLGAGTAMLDKKMIGDNNWSGLTGLARQFRDKVDQARSELRIKSGN